MVALFISTVCELSGLFLFAPLLLFTLRSLGFDSAEIGWVSASQWLGMALAAPFTARWVRRLGTRRALILSGLLPWLSILLITLSIQYEAPRPLAWAALYLVAGGAAALRWIVAEATVATLSPPAWRGRLVGLYATLVGATFVIGPTLLAALGSEGAAGLRSRWVAVALLAAGVALTLLVPSIDAPRQTASTRRLGWAGLLEALRAEPAVLVAGFIGGFFEAGLSSILPLYGLSQGLSSTQSALLVSASGLGSAVLMLPAGLAADRWPVGSVRRVCGLVNLLAALLMPVLVLWPGLQGLNGVLAFIWGGAGGALYTLAMVGIGHRWQGEELVNATAVLVLSYTLGGLCAPALGGMALQWGGTLGLPMLLVGVASMGVLGFALPQMGSMNSPK